MVENVKVFVPVAVVANESCKPWAYIADTGTENPEPVPPIDAAVALKTFPTRKFDPRDVMVTEVTALPDTTTVAFALNPDPLIRLTLVYVPCQDAWR